MITTTLLANHPKTIPTLIQWFRAQWPDYHAQFTDAEMADRFTAEAQRNGLPIRLLAFVDGELAGTITLREQAIHSLPEYHPGLGGLLVLEPYRQQGVGTALVKAGMKLAQEQAFHHLYATTVAAKGILTRLEWQQVRAFAHDGKRLLLYHCELRTP